MLDATLSASESGDDVDLELTVRNTGDDAVALSFSDGQRAEYLAEDRGGSELWRYSDDRMVSMAMATEDVASGETTTDDARWADPPVGEYTIRAWVVADDTDADAETTVTVTGG